MDSLNQSNFFTTLDEHEYVTVCFFVKWSADCLSFLDVFESVAHDNNRVKFFKVDCDENPDLYKQLDVKSFPTLLFYKGQDLSHTVPQAIDASDLKNIVDEFSEGH